MFYGAVHGFLPSNLHSVLLFTHLAHMQEVSTQILNVMNVNFLLKILCNKSRDSHFNSALQVVQYLNTDVCSIYIVVQYTNRIVTKKQQKPNHRQKLLTLNVRKSCAALDTGDGYGSPNQ